MEDQKLFNNQDDFFIAEKLDALMNSIPVPPHTEKEFNDKDKYIIWTKLFAPSAAIVQGYGQGFGGVQTILPTDSVVWAGIQNNLNVSIVGTDITASKAGVYQFHFILEIPPLN